MKPKVLLATLVFLCVGATLSWGATTGGISGVITDAQSGEPVVGATVMVMGTSLGASTDVDGRYMIINVPVDTYTLQLSSVGYATVEISNVSVSLDLTTYQSQTMSSEATDIGTTIRVVAERKLIIEDKTTSVNIVTRDELLAMPTRGFEQVVGIQNSVVRMNSNAGVRQRGFRAGTATGSEINMRGGRPSEVAYYVDGFSQQDPLTGISTANINNNAIKEVQVTSGAFSAEYGHVASGIVNVTTNSGGDEYHGNVEVLTDNLAGEFGYDSFDHNYYSGDFSGPIPGLTDGFFFFSGERRYLGDREPSSKMYDITAEFGLADDLANPWRKPANSLAGWSYQGKIDYNFSPNLKLGLSGNGSIDKWQRYTHNYLNPDYLEQIRYSRLYEDKNLGLNAKITHTLNAETFYNFSASWFQTTRFLGDGVIWDDYDSYERAFANPEQDAYQLFQEGTTHWLSDDTSLHITPGSDEDSLLGYDPHYYNNFLDRRSAYLGLKGRITSQVNSSNTVTAGFDFQRHTLRRYRDLNPTTTGGYSARNINNYGFDTLGNVVDSDNYEASTKHPMNLGVFVQDRLEYRGLIVQVGLRFDYFDYKALGLIDPELPFDPGGNGMADVFIDEGDLEATEKFTRISPRLGISFPISDKTQMHINYGIFYQRPDLTNLYTNYNFMSARLGAGSYFPFPSPKLEPETVTQYEVGMDHQLGENVAFNLTAYYKDVKELTQIFHQAAIPTAYDYYSNEDFGTIKGVDFSLNMRRTRGISASLRYSLSYASGTGSFSQSTYNIAWKNPGATPKVTNPLDYDQRHSIIGMMDFRTGDGEGPRIGEYYPLENLGFNVLFQMASGLPYTPSLVYDAVASKSVAQNPTGPINSAHMPWTMSLDIKVERKFTVAGYEVIPYLVVKNLLNHENITTVYEGTGKPYSTGYLESAEGQVRADDTFELDHFEDTRGEQFAYRYDLLQNDPTNWGAPRMILVGLRMSF